MRTLLTACLLATTMNVAWAQIVVPEGTSSDLDALTEAANRIWIEAYTSGDVEALVKMHAPESLIQSPFGRMLEGLDGAREYYTMAIAYAPKNRHVTIKESKTRQFGDLVIQNSTWDFSAARPDDTPVEFSGRSSVVVQRTPDGLYIVDYHPAVNPPPMQN